MSNEVIEWMVRIDYLVCKKNEISEIVNLLAQ